MLLPIESKDPGESNTDIQDTEDDLEEDDHSVLENIMGDVDPAYVSKMGRAIPIPTTDGLKHSLMHETDQGVPEDAEAIVDQDDEDDQGPEYVETDAEVELVGT